MSEPRLEIAKQLIQQKEYSGAKKVLEAISEHPTAKAWLKRLQEIEFQSQLKSVESFPVPITLPMRLEVILKNYLSRDEIILWYEQPEPNIFVNYYNPNWISAISLIIGFGLLIFQFYLQVVIIHRAITSSFYIQLLPSLVVIFTPIIRIPAAKRIASNTHYVITNHRGFIIENLKVRMLTIKDVIALEIIQEKAGFTSLMFQRNSVWRTLLVNPIPRGFLGIAKAGEVKQLISKYWHIN